MTDQSVKQVQRWPHNGFDIESHSGGLVLEQVAGNLFELGDVTIRYCDEFNTGLEHSLEADQLQDIRVLTRQKLIDASYDENDPAAPPPEQRRALTDLASVPGPMRWFTNSYGPHTPAALIHDRLIPKRTDDDIEEWQADRYFRFMLGAVGVPRFKRYIMWTAVAMRTRWKSPRSYRKVLMIAWVVAAVIGMAAAVSVALNMMWNVAIPLDFSPLAAGIVAAGAPVLCCLLWGRQWAAAAVAALAAPFMLPPAALASIAYGVYRLLEFASDALTETRETDPAPSTPGDLRTA